MKKNHSATGLSSAISKTMDSFYKGRPLFEKPAKSEFSIKVANTIEEREIVFNLGYQIYFKKGYVNKNVNEWLIYNYDSNSETVILMVLDNNKNLAGTATLVFDGDSILPAEKVFGNELNAIKKSGNKTAEICRLVIDPNFRNSKDILVLLFNYAAIYIHHVKNYDGLVIEVNPRHKNYYKTLLCFEEIGIEKPCPQVQNTEGLLLYLPASRYRSIINQSSRHHIAEKKDRSLYPYFLKAEQERLVANYLEKQIKGMTAEEKMYFGFTDSGICRAVCV